MTGSDASMIGTVLMAGAMLGAATTAAAQVSVGNLQVDTLAPATGPVAPPAPPSPAPAGNIVRASTAQRAAQKYRTEVVCRISVETGSLITKRKICVTPRQWRYINDENERFARSTVANAVGGQSGN